jgi:hypothetical protein
LSLKTEPAEKHLDFCSRANRNTAIGENICVFQPVLEEAADYLIRKIPFKSRNGFGHQADGVGIFFKNDAKGPGFVQNELMHITGIGHRFYFKIFLKLFHHGRFIKMVELFNQAMGGKNSDIIRLCIGQPHQMVIIAFFARLTGIAFKFKFKAPRDGLPSFGL